MRKFFIRTSIKKIKEPFLDSPIFDKIFMKQIFKRNSNKFFEAKTEVNSLQICSLDTSIKVKVM